MLVIFFGRGVESHEVDEGDDCVCLLAAARAVRRTSACTHRHTHKHTDFSTGKSFDAAGLSRNVRVGIPS